METTNESTTNFLHERNHALANRSLHVVMADEMLIKKLETTTDFYEANGILYYFLDTLSAPKIITCLKYAYGHDNYFSFSSDNQYEEDTIGAHYPILIKGNMIPSSLKDLRKMIAQKAYSTLCQKFFKDIATPSVFLGKIYSMPSWWRWIITPEENGILDEIVKFFSKTINLPHPSPPSKSDDCLLPNDKITIDFLYKLSTSAWITDFRDEEGRRVTKVPTALIKYRKEFITILGGINQLDFLVKNWKLLSVEDLETLEELTENQKDYNGATLSFAEGLAKGNALMQTYVLIRETLKTNKEKLPSVAEFS